MNRRQFVRNIAAASAAFSVTKSAYSRVHENSTVPAPNVDPVAEALPKAKTEFKSEIFPLRAIRLLDGPFARQQEMNRRYLLKLDPDRLLSLFRREAGLEPKAPPYRGWESEPPYALYGHILGFYMSGAGIMVQATGDPELRGA